MADLSNINLNGTAYNLKDTKARGSLQVYEVDSTSTSTAFTVTVPFITEYTSDICFILHNGVVNSAAGNTLNVNGLGAKPIYLMAGGPYATGVMNKAFKIGRFTLVTYDPDGISGGCWLMGFFDYSLEDTTYEYFSMLSHAGANSYKAHSVIYRYQLLFQMEGEYVTPLTSTNNSTGTSKTMLTNVEFDPFGEILYYYSTTTVSANTGIAGTATRYASSGFNLRYSLNCGTTLTASEPIYLKTVLQSNGKVKLATGKCWSQDLPTTNDGYLYIFLGFTTSTYQMALYPFHPVYYHDGLMSAADKTKLDGMKTVVVSTSEPTETYASVWVDTDEEGDRVIPEMMIHKSATLTASNMPFTISDSRISSIMRVCNTVFGTPAYVRSDISWTTGDGYVTFTGTISGSTSIDFDLIEAQT